MEMTTRKARMTDIKFIHNLLMTCSADGLLLPRSLSQLYGHLRDFYVVEDADNRLIGCAALSIVWENMAEIRSLAVDIASRRQGCGRALVNACLAEAHQLVIHKLFALTYQLPFFLALGFESTEKDALPQKVWMDCIHCPKFPDCDESAVIINL